MESGAVTHRAWLVRTNWSSQNCRVGLELDLECREVSEPTVIAIFRLAIAEAIRAPEVARALDSIGRETSRAALRQIMARAQTSRLLDGPPAQLAEQFGGLLWCDLMVSLLLGVAERPSPRELRERAHNAAAAFLELHPLPEDHAVRRRG